MALKGQTQPPFNNPREAALALLIGSDRWSRKAAGFLGHMAVIKRQLTAREKAWLEDMLLKAGYSALSEVEDR
ncbi:hypothetical protein Ga0102493_11352 [Erythrobacter litoralis]|uniref:Uncharacterized protein n=1 Tax=Erythrobacter litoralis TaxID=39960 RepID=A0A074MKE8_9SPHN|nr:hypothetical protein [Erythrobacter litoralis]AOL24493.1 hypothetical protein Ga0102493_11352 [Erythrobacter litoralis]KEO93270.1 hypothetical protein EH32_11130 [Erythrobacter litoralis]